MAKYANNALDWDNARVLLFRHARPEAAADLHRSGKRSVNETGGSVVRAPLGQSRNRSVRREQPLGQ
jgi:hypothetical protein